MYVLLLSQEAILAKDIVKHSRSSPNVSFVDGIYLRMP